MGWSFQQIWTFHPYNVENVYSYRGDTIEEPKEIQEKTEKWRQRMPTVKPMEINKILDKRTTKRTNNKEYFESGNDF